MLLERRGVLEGRNEEFDILTVEGRRDHLHGLRDDLAVGGSKPGADAERAKFRESQSSDASSSGLGR